MNKKTKKILTGTMISGSMILSATGVAFAEEANEAPVFNNTPATRAEANLNSRGNRISYGDQIQDFVNEDLISNATGEKIKAFMEAREGEQSSLADNVDNVPKDQLGDYLRSHQQRNIWNDNTFKEMVDANIITQEEADSINKNFSNKMNSALQNKIGAQFGSLVDNNVISSATADKMLEYVLNSGHEGLGLNNNNTEPGTIHFQKKASGGAVYFEQKSDGASVYFEQNPEGGALYFEQQANPEVMDSLYTKMINDGIITNEEAAAIRSFTGRINNAGTAQTAGAAERAATAGNAANPANVDTNATDTTATIAPVGNNPTGNTVINPRTGMPRRSRGRAESNIPGTPAAANSAAEATGVAGADTNAGDNNNIGTNNNAGAVGAVGGTGAVGTVGGAGGTGGVAGGAGATGAGGAATTGAGL